jgi:hypothetical protein
MKEDVVENDAEEVLQEGDFEMDGYFEKTEV